MIAMLIPMSEPANAGIKLNKKTAKVKLGDTLTLSLKGVAGSVKWSSDNEEIASVDENGTVAAKMPGTANITAEFFGKEYVCKIIVPKPKLSTKKQELGEGLSFVLTLKKAVGATFVSQNPNVAKVDEDGTISAVSIGNTTIIVKDITGKKYKCKVSVVYNEEFHKHTVAYRKGKDATCTETGLTRGEYCSTCGAELVKQEVIPTIPHTYDDDGICTVCGAKDPDHKEPHVHTYETASKEPTCTENGFTEKIYCPECGQVFIEAKVIKALGHNWSAGYCTRCGIPEIHEYVTEKGVAPTCTKPGRTDFIYCRICGEIKQIAEELPPLGHEYNGGYTCIRCGADRSGHIHNWVIKKKVAATCTEPGLTEGKSCSTCGYVFTIQEFTMPLGHNFVNGKCTRCGQKENQ
jgi:hypothetical protein